MITTIAIFMGSGAVCFALGYWRGRIAARREYAWVHPQLVNVMDLTGRRK